MYELSAIYRCVLCDTDIRQQLGTVEDLLEPGLVGQIDHARGVGSVVVGEGYQLGPDALPGFRPTEVAYFATEILHLCERDRVGVARFRGLHFDPPGMADLENYASVRTNDGESRHLALPWIAECAGVVEHVCYHGRDYSPFASFQAGDEIGWREDTLYLNGEPHAG